MNMIFSALKEDVSQDDVYAKVYLCVHFFVILDNKYSLAKIYRNLFQTQSLLIYSISLQISTFCIF